MRRLAAVRLLTVLPTLAGITMLAFAISSVTPGDPAAVILQRQTGDVPSEAAVAALRRTLHLDDPLPMRYGRWLGSVMTGDLGRSFRTGEEVRSLIAGRAPHTLALAASAVAVAALVGLPGGLLAAAYRGRPVDWVVRLLVLLGESWPSYVVAYGLILVFAVWLGWLPVAGGDTWAHAVLPAATLTIGLLASVVRLTRSGVLDALGRDHVLMARARGLRASTVVISHAWRVGRLLLVAFAGVRVAQLLGGAVVVETVFAWPGLGQTLVTAVFDRDYPVIQALVLYAGVAMVAINLLADLLLLWLDPRARLRA